MTAILYNGGSSDRLLSAVDAAYIAGFVDGEGTLTIGRTKRKESRTGIAHIGIMTVANTNLEILHWIVDVCGNGKIQVADKRTEIGHKKLYRIWFGIGQIRHVLPQLLPYLRLKRQQADILLCFAASKEGGLHVTDEAWEQWEQWRQDIRALNWRGTGEPPIFERIPLRADLRMTGPRTKRQCSIDECEKKHYGRGWCWDHYYERVIAPKRKERKRQLEPAFASP